ncbi:MAG: hypothetical protein WBB76_11460, partial [Gaiellaceae bacterium]
AEAAEQAEVAGAAARPPEEEAEAAEAAEAAEVAEAEAEAAGVAEVEAEAWVRVEEEVRLQAQAGPSASRFWRSTRGWAMGISHLRSHPAGWAKWSRCSARWRMSSRSRPSAGQPV